MALHHVDGRPSDRFQAWLVRTSFSNARYRQHWVTWHGGVRRGETPSRRPERRGLRERRCQVLGVRHKPPHRATTLFAALLLHVLHQEGQEFRERGEQLREVAGG